MDNLAERRPEVNTRINRSAHIPGNPNNHPDVAAAIAATIGTLVRDLLTEHPNIEFDSIRIQTLNGNTAIVSGRPPGEPFGPAGCSSCHQPAGRPHTDYCHAGGIVGADPRGPVTLELKDGKGQFWHQTGPDEAHLRNQCAPEKCGWNPRDIETPDSAARLDAAEQARLDAIANEPAAPPSNGCTCPHHQ